MKTFPIDSKQISIGGLNVRYFSGGKGEPLVIVHGAGGGAIGWMDTLPELCRHFTVYIPDLPGFGLSQPFIDKHDIKQFVEFLDNFAGCLDLKPFYLVGHSMGGAIAVRYAVQHKDKIKKLVIVDGVGIGKDLAPWIRLTTKSVFCRPLGTVIVNSFNVVKWIANTVFNAMHFINPLPLASVLLGASMTLFASEADSLILKLSALAIPMMVIWGAKDKILPVSNAYSASKLHPDCKLHIFENGGHSAYSRESTKFAALLADFLS